VTVQPDRSQVDNSLYSVAVNMFESRGRWLYCQGEPRVWFSRSELERTEHAPTVPLEEWAETATLAAMIEAISLRADVTEVCTVPQ
jgi:hypothetical protein